MDLHRAQAVILPLDFDHSRGERFGVKRHSQPCAGTIDGLFGLGTVESRIGL